MRSTQFGMMSSVDDREKAMVGPVIFAEERNVWVYEDTGEPASLTDTIVSLQAKPMQSWTRFA